MIQLIAFIYGIVVLITGKFHLGKGRKAFGFPARMAGLVLVVTPVLGFALGLGLAMAGVNLTRGVSLLIDVPMLIGSFVLASFIAKRGAAAQEAAAIGGASPYQTPPNPYGTPPMAGA